MTSLPKTDLETDLEKNLDKKNEENQTKNLGENLKKETAEILQKPEAKTEKIESINNSTRIILLIVGLVTAICFMIVFSLIIGYLPKSSNNSKRFSNPGFEYLDPARDWFESSNSDGFLSNGIDTKNVNIPEGAVVYQDLIIREGNIFIAKNAEIKGRVTVQNNGSLTVQDGVLLSRGADINGFVKIGNNVISEDNIYATQNYIKIGNNNELKDVIIRSNKSSPRGFLDAGNNNTFGTVDGGTKTTLGKDNIVLGDLKASMQDFSKKGTVTFGSGTSVKGKIIEGTQTRTSNEI
jgi:acetyltransferase-like isoleucine patch superfamily enzyme